MTGELGELERPQRLGVFSQKLLPYTWPLESRILGAVLRADGEIVLLQSKSNYPISGRL